jgi:hypothetical protein
MALMVAQAQAVAAQAKLSPLLASAMEHAGGTGALVSRLPGLAAMLGGTQRQSVHGLSGLAALRSSLHVQAININTAAIVATLGALRTAAGMSSGQSVHAVSTLGKLASSLHVQSLNVNTATIVATLPRLVGRVATTSTQAVHAHAALALWSVHRLTITGVAHLNATIGPLASSLTVKPPSAPGYAADGHYFVVIPSRPFYAPVNARPFYAPTPARPFYILSDPDMTPNFDTLDPRETLVLTLDASAELASGETLTAIETMTATQQSGPTGTAPTLAGQLINTQPITLTFNGAPITIAVGAAVQVVASGGTAGCRYLIAATCTTSNPDKILTLKGILPVSAS